MNWPNSIWDDVLLDTAKKAPDPAAAETISAKRRLDSQGRQPRLPQRPERPWPPCIWTARGVTADPVEAGKWSLLYHDNAARRMYGLPDTAPALQARLDAALNEKNWDDARARAQAWSAAPLERL